MTPWGGPDPGDRLVGSESWHCRTMIILRLSRTIMASALRPIIPSQALPAFKALAAVAEPENYRFSVGAFAASAFP
eukprot:231915-Hanusia_phi.AAC.1